MVAQRLQLRCEYRDRTHLSNANTTLIQLFFHTKCMHKYRLHTIPQCLCCFLISIYLIIYLFNSLSVISSPCLSSFIYTDKGIHFSNLYIYKDNHKPLPAYKLRHTHTHTRACYDSVWRGVTKWMKPPWGSIVGQGPIGFITLRKGNHPCSDWTRTGHAFRPHYRAVPLGWFSGWTGEGGMGV